MFRPYGLTSIVAWTAGRLAGNKAYYNTKAKQKAASASGSFSGVHVIPEYVERLISKHNNIGNEITSLSDELSLIYKAPNKLNPIPILKFVVYCDWLKISKEQIKAEVAEILQRAQYEGYGKLYSIKDIHSDIERVVGETDHVRSRLLSEFNKSIAPSPIKDKIVERINEIMSAITVDQETCAIKYDGEGLELVGLNPESTPPPKQTRRKVASKQKLPKQQKKNAGVNKPKIQKRKNVHRSLSKTGKPTAKKEPHWKTVAKIAAENRAYFRKMEQQKQNSDLKVACSKCNGHIAYSPAEYGGKVIECPHCSQLLELPQS